MARARISGNVGMMAALLFAVALALASCGGGGGGGKGGLCGQCGVSDGPCQSSVPAPEKDIAFFCPSNSSSSTPAPCDVALACIRKVDSAERVCFPASSAFEQYRCQGARADRTPAPPTPTPTVTPLATLTVTPEVTPTGPTPEPTTTPFCGDGILQPGQECNGTNLNGQTCLSLCGEAGGTLSCDDDCEFDTIDCDGLDCP